MDICWRGWLQPLKEAGLNRVTVSMDAVDAETFAAITRVPRSFDQVLAGVREAKAAGLGPVKVNCVLLRGFNDSADRTVCGVFAARGRDRALHRVDAAGRRPQLEDGRPWSRWTRSWRGSMRIVPLVELAPNAASETAKRFTFDDGVGEIGIIAPVSRPFCGHCSRVRLTSDGKIRTCLFSQSDHDLYGEMVRGGTDAELAAYIRRIVMRKEARHHIGEPGFQKPSRNMVHIGG